MSKTETMRIGELEPNNFNPNEMSEEKYAALKESIKQDGIKQPIIVRPIVEEGDPAGFEIIDGEHRFKAANELKLEGVPVIIEDVKEDKDAMRLCYKLNAGRGTIDCFKEAVFFDLLAQQGLDLKTVASEYGVSEQFIRDRNKICTINAEQKEMLLKKVPKDAELTGAHWLVYAKISPEERIEFCKKLGPHSHLAVRSWEYEAKNARDMVKIRKTFEEALERTEFKKCPTCKGKAIGLDWQKHLKCKQYHDWDPKTGKTSQMLINEKYKGTAKDNKKKKVPLLARNVHIEIDWTRAIDIAQAMALKNLAKIQSITFKDKKGKEWSMKLDRDKGYEAITVQQGQGNEYDLSMRDPVGKGKRTAYVRGPQWAVITTKEHKEMFAWVKTFKGKVTDKRITGKKKETKAKKSKPKAKGSKK